MSKRYRKLYWSALLWSTQSITCLWYVHFLTYDNLTKMQAAPTVFHFHALEEKMAAHSSILAWRIPGTVEPGGLLSMGSHRVGHDLTAAAAVHFWMVEKTFCFFSVRNPLFLINCWIVTPWTAAWQAFLPIANPQSLLKLMSIELVMPSNPKSPHPTHYRVQKTVLYIWDSFAVLHSGLSLPSF